MSKWKAFFIRLRIRCLYLLVILSIAALSSVMTYLVTRYYDYRGEIMQQETKISLLERTVDKLQDNLGGNLSTLKDQIKTPVLYEAVPIETPDEREQIEVKNKLIAQRKKSKEE